MQSEIIDETLDKLDPVADHKSLPEGEYAIVECLGHRTMVGRISEVERFGAKLMGVEPIFQGKLLPMCLVGGGSIYQFTPCSADVALRKGATREYELPSAVAAIAPPILLEEFLPAFLED